MAFDVWLAFIGAAILIAVSPGVGAIQSMAVGLTHGVRRGYWSILGLETGLMLQLTLVAVGLGAAVASSIVAFNVIKWIGVAYLAYLAVRQWRSVTTDLREQVGKSVDGGRLSLVVRGFLINTTNPKGLVFFLAVLPQFVVPTAPLLPQYLAIGATMVAVDLVVMGLYTGLAVRLVEWLHTPRQERPHSTESSPGCSPRPPWCSRWCVALLPRDRLSSAEFGDPGVLRAGGLQPGRLIRIGVLRARGGGSADVHQRVGKLLHGIGELGGGGVVETMKQIVATF
jgi:homoserine/homoserine lactone efflux protein